VLGLMVIFAGILYLFVSYAVLRFAYASASTKFGKCFAITIALAIVLWYPVIEPVRSYQAFKTYASKYAGGKIYIVVNNVDRVNIFPGRPNDVDIKHNRALFNNDGENRFGMAYDYVEYNEGGYLYEESYLSGYTGRKILGESVSRYFIKLKGLVETSDYGATMTTITDRNWSVLGSFVQVTWLGGGPMRLSIAGTPTYGSIPQGSDAAFIHSVLRPAILNK